MISKDESLPPEKRVYIDMRDKQKQKVSLHVYREESAKIFKILKRYTPMVEKASCDEAFLDVTHQVNIKYGFYREEDYSDESWNYSLFLGCDKGKGQFTPKSELD